MSYEQTADRARATLKKKGQLCRVRIFTDTGYDLADGEATRTYQDYNVYGVIFDYGFQTAGAMAAAGTQVIEGDKQCLLAADAPVQVGSLLLANGIDRQVVNVKEINPAGTVVMYDLHLRR